MREYPSMPFGLGEAPKRTYLYVEAGEGGNPWHFFDMDKDEKTPVFESAISGYLVEISLKIKYYRNKEGFKVMFKMKTPREYIIQTGVETMFARKLLLSLEQWFTQKGNFDDPMCIEAVVGDQGKVVFSTLYNLEGEYIKIDLDQDRKLLPLIKDLQAALGCEVQDIKTLREEYAAHQDARNSGGNRRG